MIVVKVELWPHGDKDKAVLLGVGSIANLNTGTETTGEYAAVLMHKGGREWKRGKVTGFKRKKLLAWDLVYLALKALIGDRHQ